MEKKTKPVEKNLAALINLHYTTRQDELANLIILIIVAGFTLVAIYEFGLSDHRSTFVPTEKIAFGNDVVREKYRNELVDLSALIAEKKTLKMIPVPFTIDSIIKNSHDRFALATVATGFGRRKGNYAGQVAKSAAVGLLTLGMYIPVSVKSSLVMHAFIFDSEKNEIAFYKKSLPVEKEPTDPEVLNRELNKLFNGYFYQKK